MLFCMFSIYLISNINTIFCDSVTMTNLTKIKFAGLDINENNYLSWVFDAEKAMILLRHYFHEGFKMEYLMVKDHGILWKKLKERYDRI